MTWAQRAQGAQDSIGWCKPDELNSATLALARLVTEMARALDHHGIPDPADAWPDDELDDPESGDLS